MIFPELITFLPQADIPLSCVTAYLSQSDTHQILFMEFSEGVNFFSVYIQFRIYIFPECVLLTYFFR